MIARLEGLNIDSFWMYEIFQGYESFARAGFLAAKTKRTEIGVGVLNSYSRHPAITAMGASFLTNLTGGRASIVLGVGGDSWVGGMLGYKQPQPRKRFIEYITLLRRLLRGEEVDYRSSNFILNKVKLDPAPQHSVPIIVACEQPKMMLVAGELADGVYLEPACCPLGYIKWAAELVSSSRPKDARFRVIANLRLKITDDVDSVRDEMKPMLAFHLSFPGEGELYLEKAGFSRSLAEEIGEATGVRALIREGKSPTDAFGQDRFKSAAELVPDGFVDQCSVMGNIDECRRRLSQLEKAGLTEVVFSFPENQEENFAILER
jgi:alkanesulfonate monooxygenase SsuD/methylene tetrahydromethanopterin reductase-like flavin-dependent oxidoreductase (luciferase family)